MPIKKDYIQKVENGFRLQTWGQRHPDGTMIERVTFRLYNAACYQNHLRNPVWKNIFTREYMNNMIDRGSQINVGCSMDQPLILTIQEDDREEQTLDIMLGKPYQIGVKYNLEEIVKSTASKGWFFSKKTLVRTERVMTLTIPELPHGVELPENLIYWKLILSNGSTYELCLPNLKQGTSCFCYQSNDLTGARREGPILLEDWKKIFRIVSN